MKPITLTGLDAQNPLAYLAALGLLRILDDHALARGVERPRLSFVDEGSPIPRIYTDLTFEGLVQVVLEDAASQATNVLLKLAYTDAGQRVAPNHPDASQDLKPPPAVARLILSEAAAADRRTCDLAAGFFTELVQDNNGNTKPTGLHFTAGQQAFLRMVEQLRTGITASDVHEALLGPWLNSSELPSLSWDASVTRLYALRASNPSTEKRGSVAAANWLGLFALTFLPVTAHGTRLRTTGITGGWKDSEFTWPIWDGALAVTTVSALLRTGVRRWTAPERLALGLTTILSSKVLRSDQGGYGSFSPAEVVLPKEPRGPRP